MDLGFCTVDHLLCGSFNEEVEWFFVRGVSRGLEAAADEDDRACLRLHLLVRLLAR
jgi:hypothetical protein|tara:strand:+ start:2565 stop:2732 length:168 start_codon:yes stop_codon:yes gene_type:complete